MKASTFGALLLLSVSAVPLAHAQGVEQVPPAAAPQDAGQESVLRVDVTNQAAQDLVLAIPALPTAQIASTAAGSTDELGRKLAQVIDDDLRNTGLFKTLGPGAAPSVPFAQVTAPDYAGWSSRSAQALVQGFVRANGNGSLTVGCYLYDVALQTELVRQGFVVSPGEWRRAGHKCADAIYTRLTGEGPYFDSQVVYVAEQGPKNKRRKQIAIMDQDGANHRFLTNGQNIVITPRLSPRQNAIVYMSYEGRRPSIWVYDMAARSNRRLVSNMTLNFAPRFSPDGRYILFSMSVGANTDIYRVGVGGGEPERLTTSPGIDTGGSYSPDGSKIVFESDRGGTQQLYVMNADGSNQRRISFGGGRYATPVWSPRGDMIAFTRQGGGAFRIGVMNPSGGGERLLTDSWGDEGPTWSPNGRVLMFFRSAQGSGRPDLWSVDLTGANARKIPTPLDGSDPHWGPIRP
ncbi:MAG: Tol-Pal system protein TolB [Sphingomonas sp.]|uniref:Tol-Pal system beta propeller repeat protein TolB n=1 Tax=Sphingomonas sp. TaxID=28214 RepID=UPI001B005AA3|nr:Tol-Pal system beta propeller repeat protein TolB [Sphingomonas sp.]MBO9624726.1 Tol-Pal system protein TolB [Sphingomonas sp.]